MGGRGGAWCLRGGGGRGVLFFWGGEVGRSFVSWLGSKRLIMFDPLLDFRHLVQVDIFAAPTISFQHLRVPPPPCLFARNCMASYLCGSWVSLGRSGQVHSVGILAGDWLDIHGFHYCHLFEMRCRGVGRT